MTLKRRIRDLGQNEIRDRLFGGGLAYSIGPFGVCVDSDVIELGRALEVMYGDCELWSGDCPLDFSVSITRPRTLRRWFRPSVFFETSGNHPFPSHPRQQAFALLEWGLNWCVATAAHQYLMIHSAIVEKCGHAVLMPALPGSGKSTLCAALVHRGWRLLSDEFGLIRYGKTEVVPFPRCIPLKNDSIDLIREFAPDAVIGRVIANTRKGDVAHVKPPEDSVLRCRETALVKHVVFPQYTPKAVASTQSMSKAQAFMKVSANSFNYELAGLRGFQTVAQIIDGSDCCSFSFSDLDDAVSVLDTLVASA